MESKQGEEKKSKVEELERVLNHLLPSPQSIRTKLDSFIDEAISVANKMTEEHAWFQCRLVYSGEAFDERTMDVPYEQTGRVFMCTFPAFKKVVIDPDTDEDCIHTIALPSVELESHFK